MSDATTAAAEQTIIGGAMESLKSWHEYFKANALKSGGFQLKEQAELTAAEKRRIGKSVAAFQLGEYSEGKGLLRSAEAFAQRADNEHLVAITKLFIAEEQFHATVLGKFMSIHGIKRMKKNWTDTVFRRLRKAVGFELSITVLITAEIIALVYYKALRDNTNSNQLKGICHKILADEFNHVRYESELINYIRDRHPKVYGYVIKYLHAVLFSGTVIVVYLGHKEVLNFGGFGFIGFWKACWGEFSNCFFSKRFAHASAGA